MRDSRPHQPLTYDVRLPDEAQAELVQVLIEMRAEHFGVDPHDDDERGALARTAEDQRLGRFAPMKRT